MNRFLFALFIILSLNCLPLKAQEASFTEPPDKIFTSALSIISKLKYEIKEINYSKGRAIFTTQTDSYILEVMQAQKLTVIKIDEINTSTDTTKTVINNIIQQLNSQYGNKQ